ncbi:MAG TPA: NUDIX hydrolase [Verrucomicrobiae bacterium]|nr:NUDIX hydrolase [Verrucomicrobiae bacterium]
MTQEEIIDIVDEQNNVIGQGSKTEAHQKGLLHRTCLALIIDSSGKWLLVKQSASRQDAGQYVLPVGGHVRSGEAPDHALKREALEEVGYKDFKYKYIGKMIYNRFVLNRHENHYFLYYEIYSDEEPVLNEESVSYRKFDTQELRNLLVTEPSMFGDSLWVEIKQFYPELL